MSYSYSRKWPEHSASTIILTQTVTETPTSSVSTTSDSESPSASSDSSTTSSSSSNPRSLPLGAIVGGVIAALILLLLFIFLFFKRRLSQRELRSPAASEIDPPITIIPYDLEVREALGRDDSVNRGSRSTIARLSSAPTTVYPPQRSPLAPSASISRVQGKLGAHTNYTVHSPTPDERIHRIPYASSSNLEVNSLSHDLIVNGATGEESTHIPTSTCIPNQDPNKTSHRQVDSTNNESDYSDYWHASDPAPPAYSRISTPIPPNHDRSG